MKRVVFFAFALLPLSLAAQQEEVPRGWNFGPLPAVGFNSDLGLQVGALCDIYYYGDGTVYPGYRHKFNVEASYYFKGSGVFHFFYDSRFLIPGARLTTALTYLPNPVMNFHGFNGAASPYHAPLDKLNGVAFYSMRRDVLRVLADFQGRLKGHLNWAAGLAFWHYKLGSVPLEKYAARREESLYHYYRRYGVIDDREAKGGSHLEMKAGLVFDTRDHEAAPSRGTWAELMVYGSPGRFSYLKVAAHFRQYVPAWRGRVVFAYHLAYQGTVAGEVPFYLQSNIATPYLRQVYSEGLGSMNTLRGMLYNRVVGDGYAWGNVEARVRLFDFRLFGQEWYMAMNPFFDAGKVVQPYRLEEMKRAEIAAVADGEPAGLVYSGRDEVLHASAGMGVKLVMNRNFIVSVEWGKPFDEQDGGSGFNIGLNYIF
jgi:hypothetical protein